MAYSTVVTYLLWLTLGWFGVHHFYLRRDRHAFVWLWTLGGFFGGGWLAEIFRLPDYVRTANREAKHHASGQTTFPEQRGERPPFRVKRFIGLFIFSLWMGCLAMTSIPEEITDIFPWLITIATPIGIAVGVHTVANIGAEQCDLIVCLVTAYVMFPFFLLASPKDALSGALTKTALVTSLVVTYNWNYKSVDEDDESGDSWWPKQKKRLLHLRNAFYSRSRRYRKVAPVRRPVWKRILIFVGSSLAVLTFIFSAIYFNTYISTDYGEKVKFRVALENFFSSPAWMAFRKHGWNYAYSWDRGSSGDFYRDLRAALDPDGEQNAYRILNLTQSATEKEINDRHRELVRKFHPDKFANVDGEEKKKIEERFIEIQQAYERVSTIKTKRLRKNEEQSRRMRKEEEQAERKRKNEEQAERRRKDEERIERMRKIEEQAEQTRKNQMSDEL